MEFIEDIPQESALLVYERMIKRPKFDKNQVPLLSEFPDQDVENENMVEISGPPKSGKTLLAIKIAKLAANCGDVIVFNCSGHVKESHFQELSAPHKVHLLEVFDLQSFEIALSNLPEILFNLTSVNCIIFDGMDNPYFSFEYKSETSTLTSYENYILGRVSSILKHYNVMCIYTKERSAAENDGELIIPRISLTLENSNWEAKLESPGHSSQKTLEFT